jgi:dihydrolipoamide dehydrogenase
VGCIPSKAYLDSSEKFYELTHGYETHGISVKNPVLDFPKMQQRVQKVVKTTCDGINYLMNKNKITVFTGTATFLSAQKIQVKSLTAGSEQILEAKNFVIATGSKPVALPHIPVDKKRIITSTEALSLPSVPKRLLVMGAGAIGLEMGSVYARLGSEVHVFEAADRILALMDSEVSKEMTKALKKNGLELHTSTLVTKAAAQANSVVITATTKSADGSEVTTTMEGDYLLVAVGRKAYTQGLGLEALNITLDARGKIPVNEHCQTAHSHIYAIGDVIAGPMLAHKAEEEGVYVAELLVGQKPHLNRNLIPNVVYTWPEASSVGITEEEALSQKISYKKGIFPMKALGRARASEEFFGFVKIIAHKESDEVLGVHMVGPRCADLIMQAVQAMEYKASCEDLARMTYPHPTYTEALKEAALSAWINKPLHL